MSLAATRPAPMALITVAAPVTMSPPAQTRSSVVRPGRGVRHHRAVTGALQARRLGEHQRIGPRAQRHHHRVHGHVELGALHRHRAAPAAGIGLTQRHADAADARHPALLVAEHLDGVGQKVKDDALFLGVMHLFGAGGHLLARAAIDDVHLARAQPQRAARRVHRHVARAHHRHAVRPP